jgi:hypothetical protein
MFIRQEYFITFKIVLGLMEKETTFPAYRKLKNGKSIYEIVSENEFYEIQLINEKRFMFHIRAISYFEKIRVKEILMDEISFEKIDQATFLAEKNKIGMKE